MRRDAAYPRPFRRRGEASDVVARFHGGHLDGQLISPWPEPPGRSVWAQPGVDGAIVTDSEPQDQGDGESPGFDHDELYGSGRRPRGVPLRGAILMPRRRRRRPPIPRRHRSATGEPRCTGLQTAGHAAHDLLGARLRPGVHLCQEHWRQTSIEGRDELWRLLGIPPRGTGTAPENPEPGSWGPTTAGSPARESHGGPAERRGLPDARRLVCSVRGLGGMHQMLLPRTLRRVLPCPPRDPLRGAFGFRAGGCRADPQHLADVPGWAGPPVALQGIGYDGRKCRIAERGLALDARSTARGPSPERALCIACDRRRDRVHRLQLGGVLRPGLTTGTVKWQRDLGFVPTAHMPGPRHVGFADGATGSPGRGRSPCTRRAATGTCMP